jgi:Ca2+-binding RTX toxin-like protein
VAYRYVPSAYATIQAAVVGAANGDTIVVSPTYTGSKGLVFELLSVLTLDAPSSVTGIDVISRYASGSTFTLAGGASVRVHTGNGNDTINGNIGNDTLYGGSGMDTLYGSDGNDTLEGESGDDMLWGGKGNDILRGSFNKDTANYLEYTGTQGVTVNLASGTATDNWGYTDQLEGIENVIGSNLDDTLTGGGSGLDGGSVLTGNGGNDTLIGGGYADTLLGGDGNDTLTGGAGTDALSGGDGDDMLTGGKGTDALVGGTGSDTASYLDPAGTQGVTVTLAGNAAIDNFGDADTLFGIENVIGSSLADTLTGDGVANVLTGNGGNDTLAGGDGDDTLSGGTGEDALDGGRGADTMAGGFDNDRYTVDNVGDKAIEGAGEGIDTVHASVDYTLGANIENLWAIAGSAGLALTGNALDNSVIGDAGRDLLFGLGGNDTLDGKAGRDAMTGGAGDDTYRVDSTQDTTVELANEGFDSVLSTVSFTLAANVEQLRLFGAGLKGTGNGLANSLFGDATFDGKLYGLGGGDTLTGGSGKDTLDGGADADTMFGKGGNDTYLVDHAGDVVREDSTAGIDDGGVDLVQSTVSFTLGAFLENLELLGTAAIDGTGNGLANRITGNAGDNRLLGGAGDDELTGKGGADTMDGGDGDDTYYADAGDMVVDTGTTGGDRLVFSSNVLVLAEGTGIEIVDAAAGTRNIKLTGDSLANRMTGNDGDNVLKGMAGDDQLRGGLGNDTLEGGLGRDRLTGGDGADIFTFKDGDSPATDTAAYDTLTDFVSGVDRIDLSTIGNLGLPTLAYAETTAAATSFGSAKTAALSAMASGTVSVVFVASAGDGWLFWNTDANLHTAEQSVRMTGLNSTALFAHGDLM